MKLRTKLVVLCGIPIAGILICAAASYILQNAINKQIVGVKTESVVFADKARQMQIAVIQVQQWLTDISATRGQDGLDDGFKEAQASRDSFMANLNEFKALAEREGNASESAELASMAQAFESYYNAGRAMAAAYVKDGTSAGNQMMSAFDAAAKDFTAKLDPFLEHHLKDTDTALTAVQTFGSRTALSILVGGATLVALTCLTGLYTIRSITQPIRKAVDALASGAEQTAHAAGHVSSASQSLAEGATEQAASLEETSAALEEMSSMTHRNAENVQKVNTLAREAREAADKGSNDTQQMSAAMEAIKCASDDVSRIIRTIDEIAFQTNILALNAAVEAARAGDAGMGFAVVADEVRNLAQRSASAARDTTAKIEVAIGRMVQGVEISARVAETLNEIASKVRHVDTLAAEVATASHEQTQGITQINSAIGQMDKVVQSNAANAEESAAAAEELNAQAGTLKHSVADLLALIGSEWQQSTRAASSQASSHRRQHSSVTRGDALCHTPSSSARS